MKQTAAAFKNIFFLMSVCCLFFIASCGLEEVIVVDAPTVTYNKCAWSDSDSTYFFLAFRTNESSQQDSFIGTEIYYKIYNNSTNLTSEKNLIEAANTSSSAGAAASRMINTYTYQVLGSSPQTSDSVFIKSTGTNRRVDIRPAADGSLEAYVKISEVSDGRIPFRYSNDKSFDFFDNDDSDTSGKTDVEPEDGDDDYKHNSTATESGTYFVQFFAVGVAYDSTSFTRSYSQVLDLGAIPIKKD